MAILRSGQIRNDSIDDQSDRKCYYFSMSEIFRSFWSAALGVAPNVILDGGISFSASGIYREHRAEEIFLFEHLSSKSVVVSASFDHLAKIQNMANPSLLDLEIFLAKKFSLQFDDYDFYLPGSVQSISISEPYRISQMHQSIRAQLEAFLKLCTEDEVDTLDLDDDSLDQQIVVVERGDSIVGVGRYSVIPGTEILADLTLLTSSDHRSKGIAKAILSKLVGEVLRIKLVPRYRVKTDNLPSIKVAESLGFIKFNRIRTYYPLTTG